MQLFKTKNNLPSSRELFFLCGNFLFLDLFTFTEKSSNDHTWQNNLKLLSIYLTASIHYLCMYLISCFEFFVDVCFQWLAFTQIPPKSHHQLQGNQACVEVKLSRLSVAQFTHTSVVTQSSQASLSVREVKLLITSCYEHMRKNKLN